MNFQTINPSNDKVIQTYPAMKQNEVDNILNQTKEAFQIWRKMTLDHRIQCIKKVQQILMDNKKEYAALMTTEMGKPLAQSRGEIEKCALLCDYYANHIKKFLEPEIVQTDAKKSFVTFEPLGVIFAIMPWNFPFWQVFRFAVPAILAGNACLLKHSPNVFGCALLIEKIFKQAKLPENLFRSLIIDVSEVERIINHPVVQGVTVTASINTGRAVATAAGRALKKCVLELGGSDPFIVLENADIDLSVQTALDSRMANAGQICISAKRFIVVDSVKEKFTKKMMGQMKDLKTGDPFDEKNNLGPLARKDLRDQLHNQIQKSIKNGAKLLLGGVLPEGPGNFYSPTVLTNIIKGMPAYDEELFGPVISIIAAKNEEEAIQIANDTNYGLGATIMTKDLMRGEKIAAEKIEAGNCFVNHKVQSDPRLPFGGIKNSGFGRELSHYGVREFVNVKTVWVSG